MTYACREYEGKMKLVQQRGDSPLVGAIKICQGVYLGGFFPDGRGGYQTFETLFRNILK